MTTFEDIEKLLADSNKRIEETNAKHADRLKDLENAYLALTSPGGNSDSGRINSPFGSSSEKGLEAAFLNYAISGNDADLQAAQKSLNAGSDPDGGYLLIPEMEKAISKYLRARSPMRRLARVVATSALNYQIPVARGTAAYGWVGETTARSVTSTPKFGMVSVPSREVYAMPSVTQILLDDNEFDLENWLIEEIGEAFGDAESEAFINGDGIAKPRGLFAYPCVSTDDTSRDHDKFQYVPTGGAGAFAANDPVDALIKLVYTLKPQYRTNASWLVSPEFLESVRKLKNPTTDDYIWQESAQAGQPATLLGYPVEEDENIPPIGANSLSAAFGDFNRAYTITDRLTSFLRDPYTNKPYVNFYTRKRVGGGAGRDMRAVKFLKFSST